MSDAWITWVAGQPVLVAGMMVVILVQGLVIRALYYQSREDNKQITETLKSVIPITIGVQAAMSAHTMAIERLTDAARNSGRK